MGYKQYHYVVVFDEHNNKFDIDWDTTSLLLEDDRGAVFDPSTAEWESYRASEALQDNYNDVSDVLSNLLVEYLKIGEIK